MITKTVWFGRPREAVLYVTADHFWFYTHNLVETANEFYKNRGRYLFIDEVPSLQK